MTMTGSSGTSYEPARRESKQVLNDANTLELNTIALLFFLLFFSHKDHSRPAFGFPSSLIRRAEDLASKMS